MADQLRPRQAVSELSPRDRRMGEVNPNGMGLFIVGDFPSWNAQRERLGLPLPASARRLPPTGTEPNGSDALLTAPSRADFQLIKNPTHAGNRRRIGDSTHAQGTRDALIAASRTRRGERSSATVRSPQELFAQTGTTVQASVERNTNRAARHAHPTDTPQPIFDIPPQTFSPDEPIARAPQLDSAASIQHHEQMETVISLLGHSDPLVRTIAPLAASESLKGGKGLMLEDPALAMEIYVANHPGVIGKFEAAQNGAAEMPKKPIDRGSQLTIAQINQRRKELLERLGITYR